MKDDENRDKTQDEERDADEEHIVQIKYRTYPRWKETLYVAVCGTCFWEGEPKPEKHRAIMNGGWHLRGRKGRVEPGDD